MPYSTYMKPTDERPAETDIRLSLASYSYIYPLGIVEDVLVEVAEHVFPVDFMILDTGHIFGLADRTKSYPVGIVKDVEVHIGKLKLLNEFYVIDMKKYPETPLLVGRGFLATANAVIDCRMAKIAVGEGITRRKTPYYAVKDFFDALAGECEILEMPSLIFSRIGTISLRSGKSKVSFHRISDSSCMTDKGVKNDIEPIAPIVTVNRLVLEWEERIRLHLEKEMKFNQWRGNNFKNKPPASINVERGMDDEGEVTLYLMRRSLEVLRKFHWMILGGRFNQLSHVSSPLLSKPGEY
ncbi:reverse transcriptase domain-containing protein [Tanacetum coccineum]